MNEDITRIKACDVYFVVKSHSQCGQDANSITDILHTLTVAVCMHACNNE